MRWTVLRITPTLTVRWRGMFAECWPHGHLYLVCSPSSLTNTQPASVRHLMTSLRFIGFMTITLDPLEGNCLGGLEVSPDSLGPRVLA